MNVRRPFGGEAPTAEAPDPAALAYERGVADGERRAHATLEQRTAELRGEIAASLAALVQHEERREQQTRELLTELALAVASRIVRERVEAGDALAARALAEALEALPTAQPVQARLHPQDLEAVRETLEGELARGRIELVPDETLTPGGCVVRSESGIVDARLETAQGSLRAALEGRPVAS
jgi:flagellar assembly protein FliH